ncbi:HAMP domain-containing protein [bacterium]|nr:HAMP domain-containing protein [bacterium]
MTLTTKMVLGFALLTALLVASAVLSIISLNRIQAVSVIAATAAKNESDINRIKFLLWDVRMGSLRLLLDRNEEASIKLNEAEAALNTELEAVSTTVSPALQEEYKPFTEAISGYLSALEEFEQACHVQDWETAQQIRGDKLKVFGASVDETSVLTADMAAKLVEESREERRMIMRNSIATSAISGGLAALFAVIIAFLLLSSIKRPLRILSNAARVMSEGDFTIVLEHSKIRDEIGTMTESFIEMKNNTRRLIQRVSDAASHVAAASQELSASAEESGKAVQSVSHTVQEVARGSQDTTSNVTMAQENLRQNAKAIEMVSRDIEEVAAYATQAATHGSDGKRNADEAMEIINHASGSVKQTAQVVGSLGDKTKQIGDFISIITGIADQTNLLALNAAIEAARAGDAGRGFAVVAEEVRKLAEESNTAAGNITSLVKSIEQEMQAALAAMQKSEREVSSGAITVTQASAVLAEIVKGVEALSEKVQSISAAAQQINASTSEVVNSMQAVAAVAEQNAAASEEVSSAMEEQSASTEEISSSAGSLAQLSTELQVLVGGFKVS